MTKIINFVICAFKKFAAKLSYRSMVGWVARRASSVLVKLAEETSFYTFPQVAKYASGAAGPHSIQAAPQSLINPLWTLFAVSIAYALHRNYYGKPVSDERDIEMGNSGAETVEMDIDSGAETDRRAEAEAEAEERRRVEAWVQARVAERKRAEARLQEEARLQADEAWVQAQARARGVAEAGQQAEVAARVGMMSAELAQAHVSEQERAVRFELEELAEDVEIVINERSAFYEACQTILGDVPMQILANENNPDLQWNEKPHKFSLSSFKETSKGNSEGYMYATPKETQGTFGQDCVRMSIETYKSFKTRYEKGDEIVRQLWNRQIPKVLPSTIQVNQRRRGGSNAYMKPNKNKGGVGEVAFTELVTRLLEWTGQAVDISNKNVNIYNHEGLPVAHISLDALSSLCSLMQSMAWRPELLPRDVQIIQQASAYFEGFSKLSELPFTLDDDDGK